MANYFIFPILLLFILPLVSSPPIKSPVPTATMSLITGGFINTIPYSKPVLISESPEFLEDATVQILRYYYSYKGETHIYDIKLIKE